MSRKTWITFVALIAIVAAGVFVVAAQDDDDGDTPPFGPGWMHNWDGEDFGPGMMWGGRGMHGMHGMRGGFGPGMMWGDGEPMMFAVAEALGLEPDAFFEALRDGQTLAEIAEAQGVELDTVYDAMFAEAEVHMANLVEAGMITQEQADEHLTWMRENIASMPMFTGGGFGPCMGGEGGFGPGMMGRGRWNNG